MLLQQSKNRRQCTPIGRNTWLDSCQSSYEDAVSKEERARFTSGVDSDSDDAKSVTVKTKKRRCINRPSKFDDCIDFDDNDDLENEG
jgi:hypothetical protein